MNDSNQPPHPVLWPSKPSTEELQNRFFYHPPKNDDQLQSHEQVNTACYNLAVKLVAVCPAGRNLSLMLTRLEEVRSRAHAAIACDWVHPPEDIPLDAPPEAPQPPNTTEEDKGSPADPASAATGNTAEGPMELGGSDIDAAPTRP